MNQGGHILIVDDEPAFLRLCGEWLAELGYSVYRAGDPKQAAAILKSQSIELILLDLALPPSCQPEEGLQLLPTLGSIPVIVMTGHGQRELALRALERGAWDFLTKPVDPDLLKVVVTRALTKFRLEQELRTLRAQHRPEDCGLIGKSIAIQNLRDLIRRIAPSNIPAMILGESGTGKELVAKAIHRLSPRHDKPFVPVHCGAIPATLLESELFGALKGSFTGADRDRLGVLDTAEGGILFLDEIGEMPLDMQVKLLRFLQEGTFTPVGGRAAKKIDVRVLCATNRDLEAMTRDGSFREDLYYRLKGVILHTPSLSERIEDIPLFVQAFLHQVGTLPKRMHENALAWLLAQPWRGNVRELQQVLECASTLAGERAEITVEHLEYGISGSPGPSEANYDHDKSGKRSLDEQVTNLEKRLIIEALEATEHNHTHAAKQLGISRVGLLKKMRRLGLR